MEKNILILEDSLIIQNIYKIYLSVEPYTVYFVRNGSEGVEYLQNKLLSKSKLPDLILTDLEMPCLNGTDFINHLNLNSIFSAIPILICSGLKPTPSMVDLCSAYIHKPFGPAELISAIRKFIL